MPVKEAPIDSLRSYLPDAAYEHVLQYLHHYKIHLKITRERSTVLGDYRHAVHDKNHRISINGNLNKFSFLVTLIHEIAHLVTFEEYGNRVQAHGNEWKKNFSMLLAYFLQHDIFPDDIKKVLMQSLQNPAASSCADDDLIRVLKKYDQQKQNSYLVEQIPAGHCFRIKGGRVFRKLEKVRKRYKCEEVPSKRIYLFSPVYEVELMSEKEQ